MSLSLFSQVWSKYMRIIFQKGMVFHTHSWLMWTGKGDYFYSNTVILTEKGAEVLTNRTPTTLTVT